MKQNYYYYAKAGCECFIYLYMVGLFQKRCW